MAHLCQVVAVYCVYKAFVDVGLTRPYEILFWSQKQAAEALARQQQFLAAVLDNVESGIVACDAGGVLTLFNRATREFHGLPQEPIPAEQWAEHYGLYHPDGKTRMRTEEVPLFRALQGAHLHDVEMTIVPRAGPARACIVSGGPLVDEDGRKRGAVVAMHDITERRRTEEAWTRSVSMLRATLESTADGILVVDLAGRIVEYNQRFAQMWQISPDLIVAGRAHDLLISSLDEQMMKSVLRELKDPGSFLAKVAELYTQPEASSFDVLEFKDGRTFERYSLPQRIAGQAVGRVWSFRDVSDRRRAEEALRRSRDQLTNLADNLPHSIVYQVAVDENRNWRFTYFSGAAQRILGVPPDEVVADPSVFYRQILEPFRPVMEEAESAAAADQSLFDVEVAVRVTDGTVKWLHICAAPSHRENGQAVWNGIVTDVTDRKRMEEALTAAAHQWSITFDAMADGVSVHGPDHTIRNVNHSLCRMLGRTKEELIGKKCYQVFHGATAPLAGCPIEKSRETLRKEEAELFEPTLNRWLAASASPILDDAGRLVKLVHTVRDITELKRAEEIVNRAHDEALWQSDEQLRLALDAGDIGTWRYDLSTSLFDLDARDRTHWGFDRGTVSLAELIGACTRTTWPTSSSNSPS